MSASISPTRCPIFDSAMARFTATVVLPTPPLPEPIATIFETPGNATGEGIAEECAISFIAPFLETLVDSNRSKLPPFESIKILASGKDRSLLQETIRTFTLQINLKIWLRNEGYGLQPRSEEGRV